MGEEQGDFEVDFHTVAVALRVNGLKPHEQNIHSLNSHQLNSITLIPLTHHDQRMDCSPAKGGRARRPGGGQRRLRSNLLQNGEERGNYTGAEGKEVGVGRRTGCSPAKEGRARRPCGGGRRWLDADLVRGGSRTRTPGGSSSQARRIPGGSGGSPARCGTGGWGTGVVGVIRDRNGCLVRLGRGQPHV
jgi:hypothetical protein